MIKFERPPNFAAIHAAFPDADKPGVIFAYGTDIYNPSAGDIPQALMRHEAVHMKRQLTLAGGVQEWWERYVADAQFRYYEELAAHAVEYIAQLHPLISRNDRARLLNRTAMRLVAPLYNYQPPRTLRDAMRDLTKEIER